MASNWISSGYSATKTARRQRCIFPHGSASQSVGVVACFSLQFLSAANYFGVPVVLLTMSFRAEPKYFPWLRKSGTYVLKDCQILNLCKLIDFNGWLSVMKWVWLDYLVWLCACLVYERLFIVKLFSFISLVTTIMVYEYFADVSGLL